MREWLIEDGIGEDRAILRDGDAIVAARVCWREPWRAGAVAQARLDHRHPGTRRGAVQLPDGTMALVDALAPEMTTGASLMVRITRAALAEAGRYKLAQCRPAGDVPARPAPSLAETLGANGGGEPGIAVRQIGMLDHAFDAASWSDLIEQAGSGVVDFGVSDSGAGRLTISPTPAMTLIDIDGPPPLLALALSAVEPIAAACARFDLGGSVGIDFPGLATREERQAVDRALDAALAASGWRGERTGMNGFGLVQLVSRLERPSLIARHARYPARAGAYALLRQAERVTAPGVLLLVAHPAVLQTISPALEAELARRSGRVIAREPRAGLALHAGFAQAIAS